MYEYSTILALKGDIALILRVSKKYEDDYKAFVSNFNYNDALYYVCAKCFGADKRD